MQNSANSFSEITYCFAVDKDAASFPFFIQLVTVFRWTPISFAREPTLNLSILFSPGFFCDVQLIDMVQDNLFHGIHRFFDLPA